MKRYTIALFFFLVFLMMQGVLAESLISFNQAVKPNPYATDDLISRAGTMNIPAGLGILTTNEIIQPFWTPKGDILPIRVEFSPVDVNGPVADIEMIGTQFYQFGNEVKDLSFSNGVPLNMVMKYFINSSVQIPYYVILRNSLDKGDSIQNYNLVYSAEYEPLNLNLSAYLTGYPIGNYKTSMGELNLTTPEKMGLYQDLKGTLTDDITIDGTLNGPVWFGSWSSNWSVIEKDPSKAVGGQFMVIFNEDWSSFSGTRGNQHSCSNAGKFTGEKVT